MDTRFFQHPEKRNQLFGLKRRLSTAESDASFFPEERLLADSHAQNLFGRSFFTFSLGIYRVRVGTIQAAEITSLQENYQADTRSVVCTQRFV